VIDTVKVIRVREEYITLTHDRFLTFSMNDRYELTKNMNEKLEECRSIAGTHKILFWSDQEFQEWLKEQEGSVNP
jgi:hypothetical protein